MTCDGFWNLGASDATDHPPAVLGTEVRAWGDAIEAQAVGVVSARRGRPIVPVGTAVLKCRAMHVAGIDKVVRIGT